jgi:hypothetical protein
MGGTASTPDKGTATATATPSPPPTAALPLEDGEHITVDSSERRAIDASYYAANPGSAAREHAAVVSTLEQLPLSSPLRAAMKRTLEALRQQMERGEHVPDDTTSTTASAADAMNAPKALSAHHPLAAYLHPAAVSYSYTRFLK